MIPKSRSFAVARSVPGRPLRLEDGRNEFGRAPAKSMGAGRVT